MLVYSCAFSRAHGLKGEWFQFHITIHVLCYTCHMPSLAAFCTYPPLAPPALLLPIGICILPVSSSRRLMAVACRQTQFIYFIFYS